MLLEFSVKNFRSIRDEQVFSMVASDEKGISNNKVRLKKYEKISVLNSAVVYGANGSGKTNLFLAFDIFRQLIYFSDTNGPDQRITQYMPYKLDSSGINEPTVFEIEFLDREGTRYLYSVSFNGQEILAEKLFYYPRAKMLKVFVREKGKQIDFGNLPGSKRKIESLLGKNQLFLSKSAKSKNEFLEHVYSVLRRDFGVIKSQDHHLSPISSTVYFVRKSEKNKQIILALLQAADLSIEDIVIRKNEVDEKDFGFPEGMPSEVRDFLVENKKYEPRFKHKLYDDDGHEKGHVEFRLSEESDGTIRLFQLASRIIEAVDHGYTLFIDEINNGLHPVLGHFIVDLFQNADANQHNAQLIFTTHDVNFLESDLFRRDQIWFVEKNRLGKSSIYSLSEFNEDKNLTKENRKVSIRNWYLSGRFGGVPVIRDLLIKGRKDAEA